MTSKIDQQTQDVKKYRTTKIEPQQIQDANQYRRTTKIEPQIT